MPAIYSSNSSKVMLDTAEIDGVQSLAFRVVTEREDIRAVGKDSRIDVSFGLRTVEGELVVRSHAVALDTHLAERTQFGLTAILKKEKGMSTSGERTIEFHQCFAEGKSLRLDAGGTAVTAYTFTATEIKER